MCENVEVFSVYNNRPSDKKDADKSTSGNQPEGTTKEAKKTKHTSDRFLLKSA